MTLRILFLICLPTALMAAEISKDYQATANRLVHSATNSAFAFQRLGTLCDTFGPRFSGSANLEKAIDWCLAEMKKDGFVNVHGEDVMVPRWDWKGGGDQIPHHPCIKCARRPATHSGDARRVAHGNAAP